MLELDFPTVATFRDELGKNINADEAAAMGAVYQAAALSKAFKVKPFLVRDAAIFPIQVSCCFLLMVAWGGGGCVCERPCLSLLQMQS